MQDWRNVVRVIFTLTLLAIAAVDAGYASPPAPDLHQQVAMTVGRDLRLDSGLIGPRLQVLTALPALTSDAGLHVVTVKREFAANTWLIRLGCTSARQCLPFDALLRAPKLSLTGPPIALGARQGEIRLVNKRTANASALAHSGEQVELVEELSGMRLRARAVCLQSGAMGDRIRVRNVSSHRVLTVTVAGQKLVRVEQ